VDRLQELSEKSLYLIREAYARFRHIACLWSMGKDSTCLLYLIRKAFAGQIPFPVIHIDTGKKLPEMYAFRDQLVRNWNIPLLIARNEEAIVRGVNPQKNSRLQCCTLLKTEALRKIIQQHRFRALLLGIRRDEHGIRAKELYFSPRGADLRWDPRSAPAEMWELFALPLKAEEHVRIHPLLHFTERDVWEYVAREEIPVCPLYFARSGKRYRSLGCAPCTRPVPSKAASVEEILAEVWESRQAERSGRAQDKEDPEAMEKLRALGYM